MHALSVRTLKHMLQKTVELELYAQAYMSLPHAPERKEQQ